MVPCGITARSVGSVHTGVGVIFQSSDSLFYISWGEAMTNDTLREAVELVQALDRMCAAHKIQDLDAHAVIQRLLASLGE